MLAHLPPTIMIVNSEVVSRTSTSNGLERNGFNVVTSDSGNDALKKLEKSLLSHRPNLVVIDNKLEGLSGIELCTILRTKKYNDIPIILVADKKDGIESLKGIANAFDDYIIRPFAQSDLFYKIKMLLGKVKPPLQSKVMSFKDIKVNLASYKVSRGSRDVHLGPTEFKLLQCFIEFPAKIFSRRDLINYVWGEDSDVEMRTIDVHINRLRAALRHPHEHIPVIKTVRSCGYCLNIPETTYS